MSFLLSYTNRLLATVAIDLHEMHSIKNYMRNASIITV